MYHIIFNPTANGGKALQQQARLEQCLKEYAIAYKLHRTNYKGHALELAAHLITHENARFIAAAGGDGTINEVINGIFTQNAVPTSEITFAALPIGTGNDFIRTHLIANDLQKAVNSIAANKTVAHSVGKLTFTDLEGQQATRFFINVAGFAYDAYACERAQFIKNPGFPSKLFYLFLIFKCLFGYTPERIRVTLDDGETIEDDLYTVNIGVCNYSGGGAILVPQADPQGDVFGVTIIRKVSKWNVVKSTPLFYNGKIGTHPQATLHTAKKIKIEGLVAPTRAETEGEYLGVSPAAIELLPKALFVVSNLSRR